MPNFQRWDKKYYYQIHCDRQKAQGNTPLSYSAFVNRLRWWMSLYDAIYTPRAEFQVRDTNKTPIQDAVRRRQINKEENIQILDLDHLRKLEMNQIKMPKPRKTLLQKVREWIKKKLEN